MPPMMCQIGSGSFIANQVFLFQTFLKRNGLNKWMKKNSTFFEKMEPPSSLGSSGRVNAVPGVSVGRFLSLLGVNLAWQNAKFWGNEKLEPVILEQSEQRKKESAALTRF